MARKVKKQAKQKQSKPVKSMGKDVPAFVKVISVFGFIGAICTLLMGILFLVGSSFIKDIATTPGIDASDAAMIASIGPTLLIVLGIVFIGLAILDFYVARGLWKGKNWARIFMIVILVIAVLSSLMSLFSGKMGSIVSLIIEALLIWYFGFNQKLIKVYS